MSLKNVLFFLWSGGLAAQSIAITAPAPAQNLSGYSGFSFTAAVASAPSGYRVCWSVDAYQVGCATAPYSLPWNTFNAWNGTHTAGATLYDVLNNVVAAAVPVSFNIANTWPVSSAPGMTVATSLSSGQLTITATITGAVSTHAKQTTWFVDGIPVFVDTNDTSATPSYTLDETKFANGSHILAVVSKPPSSDCPIYSDWVNGGCFMTEWSAIVTFSNGAVPYQILSDQREMYLSPSSPYNTHQLSPTLYNTDGTTTATTPVYNSENPSVATVSSTGLVTAISAGGPGVASSAKIDMMAPTISGTDLRCNPSFNCTNGEYSSASHPFQHQQIGQMVTIGAAAGWVAGNYYIQSVNPANQATFLGCTGNVCTSANPGLSSATAPTSFSTGPTRTAWAMVTPTATPNPPVYHFGNDGSILSTYTVGKSMYVVSGFNSINAFPATAPGNSTLGNTDQPYGLNGNGFYSDYFGAGFTTVELGPINPPTAGETESAFQAAANSQAGFFQSAVAGTSLKALLITDTWLKNSGGQFGSSGGLFQVTRAVYSPPWSLQPFAYILNAWNGVALQLEGGDEYSDYGTNPFEGPVSFAAGNLTSIVASGGTCSANGNFYVNSNLSFIISGSVTANMNSVNPAVYHAGTAAAPFSFPCTGVANGTYNSSNDPALLLEPYGIAWLNNTTGLATSANDYNHYTMFSTVKSQINAANAGRPNITFPQIGTAGCSSTYGFANPANGLADYATKYYSGFVTNYLGARAEIYTLLNDNGTQNLGMGDVSRAFFGCYSPSAPLLHQNSSVAANYGFQGYPLTVTSFTGNTLTFSTPHNLPNIIPGVSRLTLSNMSNPVDNGNYYVLSTPNTTTMTVTRATADFICTANGGTITFENGDTKAMATSNSLAITGTNNCGPDAGSSQGCVGGDTMTYAGSLDSNFPRHRGQTFTASGFTGPACASNFAGKTFIHLTENIQNPTGLYAKLREIPTGSSTSGMATVIADNNFVPGRNGSTQFAQDPDAGFAGQIYNMILRGAGTRLYGIWTNQQGYNPAGGYVGINPTNKGIFGDTTIQGQQLYLHPQWDNYYGRPNFHAIALANLLDQRIAPYSLTASLPSPDYGTPWECTARTGAKGRMLACLNITNATETATFTLAPYLVNGQNAIQFIANSTGIQLSTISAGTLTQPVTVPQGGAVVFLFPNAFSTELQQPLISARLADVANATKIVVRYGYDQYLLDTGAVTQDCGTGAACQLLVDRNIGPVFYRLIYLNSSGTVLAVSDVQQL
jgi:hypothetical protein